MKIGDKVRVLENMQSPPSPKKGEIGKVISFFGGGNIGCYIWLDRFDVDEDYFDGGWAMLNEDLELVNDLEVAILKVVEEKNETKTLSVNKTKVPRRRRKK